MVVVLTAVVVVDTTMVVLPVVRPAVFPTVRPAAFPTVRPVAGPVGLQIVDPVILIALVGQHMVILDIPFMAVTDVLDISIAVIAGSADMVSTRVRCFSSMKK